MNARNYVRTLYGAAIVTAVVVSACAPATAVPQAVGEPTAEETSNQQVVTAVPSGSDATDDLQAKLLSLINEVNVNGAFKQVAELAGRANCVVKPDGQAYAARGAGNGGNPEVPHGQIVLDVAMDSFNTAGATSGGTPQVALLIVDDFVSPVDSEAGLHSAVPDYTVMNPAIGETVLIGVDTLGFTTGIIANRIGQAIAAQAGNVDRFVINMSFAIVPCGELLKQLDLEQYLAASQEVLDDLNRLLNLLNQNPNAPEKELLVWSFIHKHPEVLGPYNATALLTKAYGSEAVSSGNPAAVSPALIADDPLYQLLQKLRGQYKVVSIAAAGNLPWMFPLAPALWDGVVSASAEPNPDRNFNPNPGEVVLDGTASNNAIGTSFAAPRLSVVAALNLVKNSQISCTGDKITPTEVAPPLNTIDKPGEWNPWPQNVQPNVTLKVAIGDYCKIYSDFGIY